ncbi:formate/nitrite transporter family protein [Prevotella sp. tf2-5]|uniref:formate/nitrite transporter family protein n=1 Tax=Prevotella sp. tf2-5 TaxID=1761889 RepID=UPI0008ED8939|nr:formate/nitrite transporter family protein [Prevotella sp. tf2-5]SFO69291.1 Formate/nitrite transporter FocA, FNT family [Prevotella sp. tf2-5]
MKKLELFRDILPLAILAGICISIGCVVNLRVGGVAGAVLFAFGLTTVVYYGLKLYTGTAGFIRRQGDWSMLVMVLIGNIIGCLLTAWLIAYAQPDCIEPASKILAGRLTKGPLACFLLAIGCGFIMTTAVEFARKGKMLPLVFGVPVFILCGFAHSIADAFYFLVSPAEQVLQTEVLIVYLSEVLGNFVGCNLYRWTLFFSHTA